MFQLSETSLQVGHAGVEGGSTSHIPGIIATVHTIRVCVLTCNGGYMCVCVCVLTVQLTWSSHVSGCATALAVLARQPHRTQQF